MGYFRCIVLLFLLFLIETCAMTKREALKELRLKLGANEKEIKKAYRKRSLETHPDKGGSNEEFVRVAEAYQILMGNAQESSSGTGGGAGGGFSFNMSDDEKMRMANDLFFEMMDEFLVDTDAAADKMVDWIFDLFANAESTQSGGRTTYTFNSKTKKKRTPEKDSTFKSVIRWLTRKTVKLTQSILEGDSVTMTINGQTITGADIKKLREQAQQRVQSKKGKKSGSEF